jgi:chitin disaccharide deacetylase
VTTRLIVNADDFGLTSGVNRAILELHRAGVLTSATLRAKASATDESIEIARATPSLGVGCHVVLVDGEALLSGIHDLPHITDPVHGRFAPTLGQFLRTIYAGGRPSRSATANTGTLDHQIEIEARAQIQSLQSRGLTLTHIDTHKHTHMFPRVLRPVLRAARSCGIRAVRNPFEPSWSIRATPGAPFTRHLQVRLLRILHQTFRRIVAEEGFITTDDALGVLATGTLDAQTVTALLAAMPAGKTYELVTHPGYNDAELASANTRLLQSRDTEREALMALQISPAVRLISFAQIGAPPAR